jgi:hypothetical protein
MVTFRQHVRQCIPPIAPEMEQEGEASPSRIRLPYQGVHKFQNDGSIAGKIHKMLWEMLQELGYGKQLKYYETQVMYEGSEHGWHVLIYIFTPKPIRGVFEVNKIHATIAPRCTIYAEICDAARQAYLVTRSCHRQLLDRMEYAHFPQPANGSTYIHVQVTG